MCGATMAVFFPWLLMGGAIGAGLVGAGASVSSELVGHMGVPIGETSPLETGGSIGRLIGPTSPGGGLTSWSLSGNNFFRATTPGIGGDETRG